MRWIGYLRVSTREQSESGLGLEVQEAGVRGAVRTSGDELVTVIADEGESGKSLDRPGIRQALDLIARGEADGLIVYKLDRITRSVADFGTLLEWFSEAGAVFSALDLGIDTSTPGGELVANVFASVAQWERKMIAARTKDSLAAKRDRGEDVNGRSIPPELVERIRQMRSEGMTQVQIAERLNADKIPTARGGIWRQSTVQSVLRDGPRPTPPRKPANLPKITRRKASAA